MPKQHLLKHGTRVTPQSEPMRDDQVANSAGGYSWGVDKWMRLRRFLILGSEGGSYYATEHDLTKENITALRECIAEDGLRTVNEIVEISDSGRAPKNDQALYALAACFSLGDKETRLAAGQALPKVARIATHLYHFVAYAETMRGWGRMMRTAVRAWYDKNPQQLAYQAIKYRQRDGWSHRDLLRLAHKPVDDNAAIFDWICHGTGQDWESIEDGGLIYAFEQAQQAQTAKETADLVRNFGLPREALNTEHLNDRDVWAALLENGMPMTALIRNLATMTRIGVLDGSQEIGMVLESLGSAEAIHKARIHPLAILVAQRIYAQGKGFRGRSEWTPKPKITDALDAAFYTAFGNVPKTGKSHLLALDVSSSMAGWGYFGDGGVCGAPLSPRDASAALALVTLNVEDNVEVVGFSHRLITLGLSARQRLDDAIRTISKLPFGGTDCALPMLYASQHNKAFDAFIVYTDNETWAGNIHPKQALDQYRQKSGINARSVVVGMVSNGFTIADPSDPDMLDVVGMDTATPGLISEFVSGNI